MTTITYPDGEIVELNFDEKVGKNGAKKHSYTVLPSSRYYGKKVGATTILSVINKPFLIQWAAKMATTWISDNCDFFDDDEKGYYMVSDTQLASAKKAHSTYKDSRADEGTQLHDMIEQHIRGNEPEVPEPLQERYEAFLRWEAANTPEYLLDLMEKPLYSREYDYCGKPDIPAIVNGVYGIIDLKSGKPDAEYNSYRREYTGRFRAYSEHFYQCAAYDICLEEETTKKAGWYMILYLDHQINGELQPFYRENTNYWRKSWLRTLRLYVQRKTLTKENQYA